MSGSTPRNQKQGAATFGEAMEHTLARFRDAALAALKHGTFAGVLGLYGSQLVGCGGQPAEVLPQDLSSAEQALIGGGETDWAQAQGQRNTAMVQYTGGNWSHFSDCGNRGGCQTVEVFVKLRVKPNPAARLEQKRVGVVYRALNSGLTTAAGYYFTTLPDGYEEWHVPVRQRAWQGRLFTFNAWYQDGAGHTYFDDNGGQLHVAWTQFSQVISHDYAATDVRLTSAGVSGTVSIIVADLAYEKDIRLVYTTDGWQTVRELGMGEGGWRWMQDYSADLEQWQVELDLPGDFQRFEYAVVMRHGVVEGAAPYEFWDNNGERNHVVTREE